MTKYNLPENRKASAPRQYSYRVNPDVIDTIYEEFVRKMVVEKKFRDPRYTAKVFAAEIGVSTRYVSAAASLRFHTDFTNEVNGYRVRYAKMLLEDRRYMGRPMMWVARESGFANRQTFYAAFYRVTSQTPIEYREKFSTTITSI